MTTTTDMPVLDPMSDEDAAFYRKKFEDEEAKKHAHIFTRIYGPEDGQLAGMGHTLCDRIMRFGSVTTLKAVKCGPCLRVMAARVLGQ